MSGLILNIALSELLIMTLYQIHKRSEYYMEEIKNPKLTWSALMCCGSESSVVRRDEFADSVSNPGNSNCSDLLSELFHTRTVPILNAMCF